MFDAKWQKVTHTETPNKTILRSNIPHRSVKTLIIAQGNWAPWVVDDNKLRGLQLERNKRLLIIHVTICSFSRTCQYPMVSADSTFSTSQPHAIHRHSLQASSSDNHEAMSTRATNKTDLKIWKEWELRIKVKCQPRVQCRGIYAWSKKCNNFHVNNKYEEKSDKHVFSTLL